MSVPARTPPPPSTHADVVLADGLYTQLTAAANTQSFWEIVYQPYMDRNLTRATVVELVRRGLQTTHGQYKGLIGLFHMHSSEYKRFLNFLRKHRCLVDFREFRDRYPEGTVAARAPQGRRKPRISTAGVDSSTGGVRATVHARH